MPPSARDLTEGSAASGPGARARHSVRLNVALGYFQQPRLAGSGQPTLLLWNATSHADPHSPGCPSAPAMQHSGGADVTVALHR